MGRIDCTGCFGDEKKWNDGKPCTECNSTGRMECDHEEMDDTHCLDCGDERSDEMIEAMIKRVQAKHHPWE